MMRMRCLNLDDPIFGLPSIGILVAHTSRRTWSRLGARRCSICGERFGRLGCTERTKAVLAVWESPSALRREAIYSGILTDSDLEVLWDKHPLAVPTYEAGGEGHHG
ncbi:hypothetical protein [Haloglycomyces albus]|uniref:hypothetical protein n=1 Tax=Haloglycomyces albus TaxID=526067 RepID=UPI00046D3444|nr:hypothetical protein [Haloglycomyces albus]